MVPSVDGRIVTSGWKLSPKELAEYEKTAATFDADAWLIGRVSMEPYAGKAKVPARKPGAAAIARTDFIAREGAESYAVALDPSGKLTWRAGDIDGEAVITVLSEAVSDDYLAFLQRRGVSYLFGGAKELDLPLVLEKLRSLFGIKTLLLEGGGKINGTFLDAGLIDELSLVYAPVADGSVGTPSLFDSDKARGPARRLRLLSVEKRRSHMLWVRYRVE